MAAQHDRDRWTETVNLVQTMGRELLAHDTLVAALAEEIDAAEKVITNTEIPLDVRNRYALTTVERVRRLLTV